MPAKTAKDLHEFLRILKSKKIKAEEVASQLGITEGYLSNIKHGKKPLTKANYDYLNEKYGHIVFLELYDNVLYPGGLEACLKEVEAAGVSRAEVAKKMRISVNDLDDYAKDLREIPSEILMRYNLHYGDICAFQPNIGKNAQQSYVDDVSNQFVHEPEIPLPTHINKNEMSNEADISSIQSSIKLNYVIGLIAELQEAIIKEKNAIDVASRVQELVQFDYRKVVSMMMR